VLAVGDADFQKKCLGRMEDIGRSGRTVLFVSHSMPAILRLCDRVLLLDKGRVIADGSAQEITRTYLDSGLGSAGERHWTNPDEAPGDDVVRIKSVTVRTAAGVSEEIDIREPVDVTVEYWQLGAAGEPPYVNLHIFNDDGVLLFVTNDYNNQEWWRTPRGAGLVTATCRIPGNFFAEGRIFVMAAISTMKPVVTIHVLERDAVSFQVVDQTHGDGVRGEWAGEYPGVVRPMLEWDVRLHRTPETNDVVQAEEGVAR
jgi:lipopolysaccharide transport system ATP-binding protein